MRFLIPLVIFFRLVSAFGDTARNERLFYYYAYLLDAALNPTTGAQTIAANCAKDAGIGAKKTCSFNDFNKYIFDGDKAPSDGWSATSKQYPSYADLEGGDHGLSGLYNTVRIVDKANDVAALLGKCTQYIKLKIGDLPDGATKDSIKAGAFTALQGVARARMDNKLNELKSSFGGDGFTWDDNGTSKTTKVTFTTQSIPLYEGAPAGTVVDDVNWDDTLSNNPDVTKAELRRALRAWETTHAPGHNPNIKQAREGSQFLREKCT